ncbi:MAG: hypothetical protein K2X27_14655 [Candidatus Obscuribacterales bacterium]|nr:hypothetical protein [Candidatus Obscuribacterales bacterium]
MMQLNVVAINPRTFKMKFVTTPNFARGDSAEQTQAADLVMKNCVDECRVSDFNAELSIPQKDFFDGWIAALPEPLKVSECMAFLNGLESSSAETAQNPWWMQHSSHRIAYVEPEQLKEYCDKAHDCKFYEILLANLANANVDLLIKLGEFLDISAANDCALMAWSA